LKFNLKNDIIKEIINSLKFIPNYLKKITLSIFNSLARSVIFIFKLSKPLLHFFATPFKFISNLLFKITILPIYRLYLKIKNKKKTETSVRLILLNLLLHKNILHVLILFLGLIVLVNNINTQSVLAEDLGKGSIIFSLAQGDKFSNITDQAVTTTENANKKNPALIDPNIPPQPSVAMDKLTTSTPGSIFDSAITKNTQIIGQSDFFNSMLAQNNNINSDALFKKLSPDTLNTPPTRQSVVTYTIVSGDTISSIARQFNISVNTILWENNLTANSILKLGTTLRILPISGISHKVVKNETLASIAKKYSVSQEDVITTNKLSTSETLKIGQILIVPGGRVITVPKKNTPSLASVFSKNTTAPSSVSRNAGGFIWPTVSKHITQYYGWRHTGLDIGSKQGLAIYAAMDGKIIKAGWGTGYGNHVIIDHGDGKKTLYAHMSKIRAKNGQEVQQGDVIGDIGSTGWSTGPHLHFEIIINGSKKNPLNYL